MKKLAILILAATLFACSSDSENESPNLSFTIEPGLRFASSEIRINNTSTNYEGAYRWEVTSAFGSETFNSEDLVFAPRYATQYFVRLQTSQGDFETQEDLVISAPSTLRLNRLSLKEIPQDYPELYFTIVERTAGGRETRVYVSDPVSNIPASNPSQAGWDVDETYAIFLQGLETTSSFLQDLKFHYINFYDGGDNFISRMEFFTNGRGEGDAFVNGPVDLARDPQDCFDCAAFMVTADFSYGN
jgi:hypothetical protein